MFKAERSALPDLPSKSVIFWLSNPKLTVSPTLAFWLDDIRAFISPFESERNMVRKLLDVGEFIEIFIDTPLQIAEKRDVKGLYAKARAGELKNFTGIDSPYERPEKPEITIDTRKLSVDEAADIIVKYYLSAIIK